MRQGLIPSLTFVAALALTAAPAFAAEMEEGRRPEAVVDTAAPAMTVEGSPTDAPVVLFLTREEQEKAIARRALARPSSSPDMTWHGGPILASSAVQSIFWGPSWNTGTFSGDKVTGLDSFYGGFGGSNYAKTSTEYSGSNGFVTAASAFSGHLQDFSTATGGGQTGPILAEVCKEITSPVTNGFYPVYTDVKRGHARYCAWHSWGTCGSTQVQFAFFFDLDGDAGCDPDDTTTTHSQGLAALANVSAHELSEAMTDPRGTGWFDSSGAENGDKCAWTFNVDSVRFSNGSHWKLQGEWSNNAYNTNTGYPNRSGQNGCLDGH